MKQLSCLFILLSLIFHGCHSLSNVQKAPNELPAQQLNLDKNAAENKIVFLTFEVSLVDSAQDVYSFRLKNKTFSEGLLKKSALTTSEPVQPGYLYYQLSSEPSTGKNLVKVQNPLQPTYEFTSEQSGSLDRRTLTNKRGDLTIRFQYQKELKYLTFYKPVPQTLTLKKVYHAEL
ncbi:hypothetical protein ACX0G7_11660 [Flavitalea antarctica]